MMTPRTNRSLTTRKRSTSLAFAITIATATATALVTPCAAADATLDAERCAAQQPAIERFLQRGRQSCLDLADRRDARGLDGDFQRCEARQIERWGERMRRAGCDIDGGGGEPSLARQAQDTTTGEAWVTLQGETAQVRYRVVDGLAILQGDMILGTDAEVREGDRRVRARLASGVAGVKSHTRGDFGWSKNVIPFEIASNVSQTLVNRINQAVTHWNSNTIVRLQARSGEGDFVRFVNGGDDICLSQVGKKGGMQEIKLDSSCNVGNVIHEIGHAVGLYHEQNRDDRDQFIVVDFDNMDDDALTVAQFTKGPFGSIDRDAFDFNSRLLYSSFAFSNNGQPTMTRPDGSTWTSNLTVLSTGDIVGVTRMVTGLNSVFTLKDKFRNKSADRCLDGASGGSGAAVEVRTCTGAARQRWLVYTHPRTLRKLMVNERSGMCLDVPGGATATGLDLQQFPCHGGTSQAFGFTERSFPWDPWKIQNSASGRCVALESTANGGDVEQRACGSSDQQKWFQELL